MKMCTKLDPQYLKNPDDLEAVANAKVTLAIMELAQKMRHQIPLQGVTSLGGIFCPVFMLCPEELHLACGKFLQSTLNYTDDELAQSLDGNAYAGFDGTKQDDDFNSFISSGMDDENYGCTEHLFDIDNSKGHTVESEYRQLFSLTERFESKRDKIVSLIEGHEGFTWMTEVLNKPTPASRKLFAAASRLLRSFIAEGEKQTKSQRGENIELLRVALNLDDVEVRFLELADTFQRSTLDNDVFSAISRPLHLRRALAALCGFDYRKKRGLLDSDGMLQASGLFETTYNFPSALGDLLNLSELGQQLLSKPFYNMGEMACAVLHPFKSTHNQHHEWPHLEMESSLLLDALITALESREAGINILLHGAPGTGKTQFAHYLCTELECTAYVIAATQTNGGEAKRQDRLSSLRLSQLIAGDASRTVLVVDEAEDIFQSSYNNPWAMFAREERTGGKGWTNQLLENNKHPVIWISNKIDHLDPAYVRRFAYVIEFKTLPRAQRLAIAKQHLLPVGASAELLQKLSHNRQLTPAMLASAAKFTFLTNANKAAREKSSSASIDDVVQHHITTQMQALGHNTDGNVPELVTRFDKRYLNVKGNTSAEKVSDALVRTLRGGAVFSGPPGTGKTQFAAHIAEVANLELLYRTASDINTMWFGESERNVAKLFEECDVARQMILLDEADTLLMARSPDAHRPGRAVTTEFLRHLEAFKGIFICATNHSDMLDSALMRRFVFRLEFLPLTTKQRSQMFAEVALGLEHDSPSSQSLSLIVTNALCKLDRLTAGDFANVKKRFTALAQAATADEWLIELAQEQEAKGDRVNSPMGFVR